MKIAFMTLGCKVNQYETQALKEAFCRKGFSVVPESEPADVCVVNTCSVTNLSDRKSRQAIRRFRKDNPKAVIAVTGCYAQTGTETLRDMPEVDLIAGTNEKHHLPRMVERYLRENGGERPVVAVHSRDSLDFFEDLGRIEAMEGRTRAYVKIQEGCDRFCSYCIIPYARGPVRSRPESEILAEIRALAEKGYPEIVLTGINTALYGGEAASEGRIRSRLYELLEKLEGIPGDFRIRLSSLEPTVIDKDYVKQLLTFPRLCHHLHLSVQSGSDSVLKAMNRHYSIKEYLEIVEVLKNQDPQFGITTDVIVGFPGEGEADFQSSLQLSREVDFCKIHIFRYSKRNGTPAAIRDDQIPSPEKNRRSFLLSEEAEAGTRRFFVKNEGKQRNVILEELSEDGSWFSGLTDNYIKVYVKSDPRHVEKDGSALLHCIKKVKLEGPFLDGMAGHLI